MDKKFSKMEGILFIVFAGAHPHKVKKVTHGQEGLKWVFLGNDFLICKKFVNLLGDKFELIPFARQFRKIAEHLKKEYVQWQDDLNAPYKEQTDWWLGAISSRNIHQSHIFQYICFLETFKEIWFSKQQRPGLVVVESPALAKVIKIWAIEQGVTVKLVGSSSILLYRFSKSIYTLLRWGKFWTIQVLRCIAAKVTRFNAPSLHKESSEDFLIITLVNALSLSATGDFEDSYFPFLYEFIEKKGHKIAVYPFLYNYTYNYLSIFKRLRASKIRFLIPEDMLDISDYWNTFTYSLRVLCRKSFRKTWKDFDISGILQEEQLEQDVVVGLESTLVYRFFSKLQKSSLPLKQAVMWYENRNTDRAVVMGLRKSFPDIKIKGAQGFLHHPYYLSLHPSEGEVTAEIVPDIILTVSEYESSLAQAFTKDILCQSAAALRYQHLFEKNTRSLTVAKDENTFNILVILPYSFSEAIEILDILYHASPQLPKMVHFYVKAHPTYTLESVKKKVGFGYWESCFRDFEGSLSEGLQQANIVISSSSSAMVEAVVNGIPVIFVGGQTSLEGNLIVNQYRHITTDCFSSMEVVKAISFYMGNTVEEFLAYCQEGGKLRDYYFLPVNEKTLRPYVDEKQTRGRSHSTPTTFENKQ